MRRNVGRRVTWLDSFRILNSIERIRPKIWRMLPAAGSPILLGTWPKQIIRRVVHYMLRHRFIPSLVAMAALFLLALPVDAAYDTPEAVAEAYIQHFSEGDWIQVAGLMDPEILNSFKQLMLEIIAMSPDDDPEEAEILALMFGPGTTRENLAELDPLLFFAAILQLGTAVTDVALIDGTVLGTVYETPELAHVVARNTAIVYGQFAVSSVEVMTLVKKENGWRVAGEDQINAILEMMEVLATQM